jgi:hypothetical protein
MNRSRDLRAIYSEGVGNGIHTAFRRGNCSYGGMTNTTCQKIEQPYNERWQILLDDPAFRRLLRDGHCADATAYLPTQLGDEE